MHNGMYAIHKTCEHDAWRNNLYEIKAKAGYTNPKDDTTPSTTQNLYPVKNHAFIASECTALCTQAGLYSDSVYCIWSDACRDSGNE